uniref:Helicase n=1 Tax=Corriparta virus TaxID=40053 RepID=A0A8E8U6Q2_9REOV|nr:helicase [Corriparta virus]
MTRVLVLAPGDLISQITTELKNDGVRFEYDLPEGVQTSGTAEMGAGECVSGGGSRMVRGTDRAAGSDEKSEKASCGSAATPGSVLSTGKGDAGKDDAKTEDRSSKDGDRRDPAGDAAGEELGKGRDAQEVNNNGDVGKKHAEGDVRGDVGLHTKAVSGGVDRGGETKKEGTGDAIDVGSKKMVLTKSVASAIMEHTGMEPEVVGGDVKDKMSVLQISNAVGKYLGMSPDMIREQTDILTSLKKEAKKKKLSIDVVRVESEAKFNSIFPSSGNKKVGVGKMSGVGMVTNKKEYVSQASVMFTSPTGDPGWKEVSREAMKRSNIRAYVHDPEKSGVPSHEALVTLIRSL